MCCVLARWCYRPRERVHRTARPVWVSNAALQCLLSLSLRARSATTRTTCTSVHLDQRSPHTLPPTNLLNKTNGLDSPYHLVYQQKLSFKVDERVWIILLSGRSCKLTKNRGKCSPGPNGGIPVCIIEKDWQVQPHLKNVSLLCAAAKWLPSLIKGLLHIGPSALINLLLTQSKQGVTRSRPWNFCFPLNKGHNYRWPSWHGKHTIDCKLIRRKFVPSVRV